jgi:hypothetical protein
MNGYHTTPGRAPADRPTVRVEWDMQPTCVFRRQLHAKLCAQSGGLS